MSAGCGGPVTGHTFSTWRARLSNGTPRSCGRAPFPGSTEPAPSLLPEMRGTRQDPTGTARKAPAKSGVSFSLPCQRAKTKQTGGTGPVACVRTLPGRYHAEKLRPALASTARQGIQVGGTARLSPSPLRSLRPIQKRQQLALKPEELAANRPAGTSLPTPQGPRMPAGLMDAQSSEASPSDLLQDLAKHRFQALEEHFQALTTTLNLKMDGMGARLQALQRDVDELMLQAGVQDSAQEPQAPHTVTRKNSFSARNLALLHGEPVLAPPGTQEPGQLCSK